MAWTATVGQGDEGLEIVFPDEMIERMHLREGDELVAADADGGVLLTRKPHADDAAMEAFRIGSDKYAGALRKLAE
jgi:bifunctional DNA-binding transcriptional regulator/antitoxin component of YhaV-PrlF toxin-antitoxin module